jgi:hypothetical protein
VRTPFTKENAVEMAKRANAAIAARKLELAAKLAQLDEYANEDQMIARTKKQLVKLDNLIDEALDEGKVSKFIVLSRLKRDLWEMVLPKQAPAKQRNNSRRSAPPTASDV